MRPASRPTLAAVSTPEGIASPPPAAADPPVAPPEGNSIQLHAQPCRGKAGDQQLLIDCRDLGGRGSIIEVCTASTGSKRCARRIRLASETRRKSAPSPPKLHGRPLLDHFEPRLIVPAEQHVGDPPCRVLVCQLKGFRSEPLDVDDSCEGIRQDPADSGIRLEVVQSAHSHFSVSPLS